MADYLDEVAVSNLERLTRDSSELERHFTGLINEFGDGPQAVQWRDVASQERRFQVLSEIGDLTGTKILDFGCGTAHLLTYLKRELAFSGEYVGYDLSHHMLEVARGKHPGTRLERRNILTQGAPDESFDYVLISGVFNNRVKDNWGMMTGVLERLYQVTRLGIAFNALSTYVDVFNPALYHADPSQVLQFCKERLSPQVTVRHDYLVRDAVLPYEFTVYVYRSEFAPVSRRA